MEKGFKVADNVHFCAYCGLHFAKKERKVETKTKPNKFVSARLVRIVLFSGEGLIYLGK